jgi:hypothetical protein
MNLDYINQLLRKKSTSIFIFCIAILAKTIQQIYFFAPTLDRACQLVMAKNFLNGNGLTINKVLADGVSQSFAPLSSWPLGYPFLVGLISFIFHISILNAAIVFDCLSIILIIYFSRRILLTINCQLQWVNIYTLLIGFFLYDFSELPATDLNALAFYLWSFTITLQVIKRTRIGKSLLIFLIFINIIPLTLKYLYAPLILIPPLYLLWLGYKIKNNSLRKIGLQFTIGTVLLTAALFIFQRAYSGNSFYLTAANTGFFFSNLRNIYYIIISSFTNIVFDYAVLQYLHIIKFGEYYFVIWWTNIILSFFLIYYFIKILTKKIISQVPLKFHYTIIGSIACLLTVFELIVLSVRYHIESKSETWTYVQEARYIAFIVVFLQQVYFIYIYDSWTTLKRSSLKLFGYIITFFLILETMHGIYFTFKITFADKNYFGSGSTDDYVMKSIREQIRNLKKDHPEKTIYFLSSEDLFSYTASLENAKCPFTHNLSIPLQTSSNSVILIVIDHKQPDNIIPRGYYKFNTIGKFDLYECQ